MKYLEVMKKAIEYIESNLGNEIRVSDISSDVELSDIDFQKLFTFVIGVPVIEYMRNRRMSEAAIEIKNTNHPIGDIAAKYTYFNLSSFSRAFNSFHGVSPMTLRKSTSINIKRFPKILLERYDEMDFKIIELPKVKMARSGKKSLKSFENWWSEKFNKTDHLFPKDFIWNNEVTKKLEWIYILDDQEDSGGFETFDFPGGLYATITCDDNSKAKSKAYQELLEKISRSNDYEKSAIENDPLYHSKYPMGHVSTPVHFKNHQFTIFVPIVNKIKK